MISAYYICGGLLLWLSLLIKSVNAVYLPDPSDLFAAGVDITQVEKIILQK